mmetsp:Transcript_6188/g.9407  ORF Transcript_6188/g.9407 Transcript_6188/m.9407 type:complete len:131 (-) Transcript_6188:53-445(-)
MYAVTQLIKEKKGQRGLGKRACEAPKILNRTCDNTSTTNMTNTAGYIIVHSLETPSRGRCNIEHQTHEFLVTTLVKEAERFTGEFSCVITLAVLKGLPRKKILQFNRATANRDKQLYMNRMNQTSFSKDR